MRLQKFTYLFSLFNIICTIPFLTNLWNFDVSILFITTTLICEFFVLSTFYSLVFWKKTTSPLVYFLLLANAWCFYFSYNFNTPINSDIIINTLQANKEEAGGLFSWKLVFIMSFFGFLPCYLYYYFTKKINIFDDEKRKILIAKGITILSSIVFIVIAIFCDFKNFLIIRQNSELFDYVPPYNYTKGIVSTINTYRKLNKKQTTKDTNTTTPIINEVFDNKINLNTKNKNVIIFIIGESQRSKSISYNGYERNTMEFLDKYRQNIINFQNFYSCNTSTFNSIPCMFSYSDNLSLDEMVDGRNFLDIFNYLKFDLKWKTNNGDCKGVCSAIPNIIKYQTDEDLVDELPKDISVLQEKNNVIFLHIRGSHGTEYYKRYPKEFEKWSPVCQERELRKCKDAEIINAYDNSMRYSMFLVSKVIDNLQKLKNINASVIFISDHGEAIGENGFYLHATPFLLTKESVGKVASFMWFNDNFIKEFKMNKQCIKDLESKKYTHFNIYHTMLGLFEIEEKNYNNKMDIFAKCKL
ncbi:MAG: phosphoethanolamine--lipid A transferase [Rickettsiales bacterium]|nr:MAG: phosphoethanolamine--lipid A transferase [Rickettsiales bacterium]